MTIKVHLVPADGGEALTLQAKPGQSLMQAAIAANVNGIEAECGGLLTCATCHVYVREPFASRLPPPSDDELGMLEFTAAPRRPNSRLSCQIELGDALDGLTVDLPTSLGEALDALRRDAVMGEGFGRDFIDYFATLKNSELQRHDAAEDKADFQLREYFSRF